MKNSSTHERDVGAGRPQRADRRALSDPDFWAVVVVLLVAVALLT